MLPREHGAWIVLIAPIIIGLFCAPRFSPAAALLFLLGSLAAFLIRTPLQALLAKPKDHRALEWLTLYCALTAGAFIPLILMMGRWKLIIFATPVGLLLAGNLTANKSGRRFNAFNEAAGVLGLCLGAPAAYYATSATISPRAWLLWLLCSSFFLGPIFHVKMAALQHRAAVDPAVRPALARMRRWSTGYHGLALGAFGVLAATGGVPVPATIPFAAAFIKTVLRGSQAPKSVDFRALGYTEVGYAILFIMMMGIAFI